MWDGFGFARSPAGLTTPIPNRRPATVAASR
jgi:hypothetical protein